eukprot:12139816-Alexandrium_andersonii.AAC.1
MCIRDRPRTDQFLAEAGGSGLPGRRNKSTTANQHMQHQVARHDCACAPPRCEVRNRSKSSNERQTSTEQP